MGLQQEVYLIIIGAAIGFLSSIGTTAVAGLINSHGQVKLYYKIVYKKTNDRVTWGFHKGESGLIFEVPIWIELHNSSNIVRVVRDFNILLFKDGKELIQMTQITKAQIKRLRDDNSEDILYGNKGAYSFVLQPRSIEKYDCHFLTIQNQMCENPQFDEIWLRYFDEKDRCNKYLLRKIEHCWEIGDLEKEGEWLLAKK